MTGLSMAYISRMERGERNVSLKNLQKMAEALGVAPSELIEQKRVSDVPILSWVSAGMMARDDVQQDVIGEIRMSDLDPRGEWVALRVEGGSMDRISPLTWLHRRILRRSPGGVNYALRAQGTAE